MAYEASLARLKALAGEGSPVGVVKPGCVRAAVGSAPAKRPSHRPATSCPDDRPGAGRPHARAGCAVGPLAPAVRVRRHTVSDASHVESRDRSNMTSIPTTPFALVRRSVNLRSRSEDSLLRYRPTCSKQQSNARRIHAVRPPGTTQTTV